MSWRNRYSGILLVDKPKGLTSHDVVYQVRRILQQQEVGHTGTLDPLASGLLVMCLGRATKVAQFVSNWQKSYVAEIRLGLTSATFDAEGLDPQAEPKDVSGISEDNVKSVLSQFIGTQRQAVPAHSAVRINGQHLYELARQGHEIEVPDREVTISAITFLGFDGSTVKFEVACSKGTYIRTLAHQIGERLGCGAYLAGLQRSQVGGLSLAHAVSLEQIADAAEQDSVELLLQPIDRVLQFASVCIDDHFRKQVGYGQIPAWEDICRVEGRFEPGDRVMIKSVAGEVLAVGIAGASSTGFTSHAGEPVASYVRVLA